MKQFSMRLALCGVLFSIALCYSKPAKEQSSFVIKRIYVTPVDCKFEDCWECATPDYKGGWKRNGVINHGNLHLVYGDGRDIEVTKAGNCLSRASKAEQGANPKISPDHHTVGWTTGSHRPCVDWSIKGTMFVNSQLVLFRDGKMLHSFTVPGTFIENWHFWNNGKYVAVGSRWHHGMGYCRLFDVNSGKLLMRLSAAEAEVKNLAWAKDLAA